MLIFNLGLNTTPRPTLAPKSRNSILLSPDGHGHGLIMKATLQKYQAASTSGEQPLLKVRFTSNRSKRTRVLIRRWDSLFPTQCEFSGRCR
jgi:hypothetical protein